MDTKIIDFKNKNIELNGDYTIEIVDDYHAIARWGTRVQSFPIDPQLRERIENGHDPVAEVWEDENGNYVCWENAREPETKGGKPIDYKAVMDFVDKNPDRALEIALQVIKEE